MDKTRHDCCKSAVIDTNPETSSSFSAAHGRYIYLAAGRTARLSCALACKASCREKNRKRKGGRRREEQAAAAASGARRGTGKGAAGPQHINNERDKPGILLREQLLYHNTARLALERSLPARFFIPPECLAYSTHPLPRYACTQG